MAFRSRPGWQASIGFGLAHPLERLAQPVARRDPRPAGLVRPRRRFAPSGAGQQPHAFDETDSVGVFSFELFPMVERLLQLLADRPRPICRAGAEPFGPRQKCAAFFVGEGFAVEGHADIEIQEPVQSELARPAAADAHLYLRPRRPAGRPPVGHPHDDARFFDARRFVQKPIRLPNRPGLRREQGLAVEQLARQARSVRPPAAPAPAAIRASPGLSRRRTS